MISCRTEEHAGLLNDAVTVAVGDQYFTCLLRNERINTVLAAVQDLYADG